MRHAEINTATPSRSIWRILLGVLIVLAALMVGVAFWLPDVRGLIPDPYGLLFSGDGPVSAASRDLVDAENRIRQNPDDEEAHLARANAYLVLGHLEGARLEWNTWRETGSSEWGGIGRNLEELQLKTDEIRAMLHEAENSGSPADRYPPIYTLLDDIANRFTGVPQYRALFLKGYLLLREGRKAEAEPIFRDKLDDYALLKDYVEYNYAKSITVAGNEETALSVFNDFIAEFPSSRLAPLANLERINIFRDLDRSEEAITECERALDSYPTSAFASKILRKWAEIYESSLDFENGAAIRVRIIREFPDSTEARDAVGMFFGGVYSPALLNESDRLEVAYAAVDSNTSAAFPILSELADSGNLSAEERAKACNGIARCEYNNQRYYEAISWADKAIVLAPSGEWAIRAGIRKGHSFWKLNKNALANDAYWWSARAHGPQSPVAAEILWKRAYEVGDSATVSQACRYIVDEYPDSAEAPVAMTMLAFLACRDGQYQTARGYADRCITTFPDNPVSAETEFWLARSLVGLGRRVEATTTYQNLALRVPWCYWGIRAAEISGNTDIPLQSADPFSFKPEYMSLYAGRHAEAWELYDAGTLDLAESEFLAAVENGSDGARCGLALVYAEENNIHSGILALRDAVLAGDQVYLTPSRQRKILDKLFPRVFAEQVSTAALTHDIPPSWLWGAMRQESSYNTRAISRSGARGLVQIMPETGRFIAAQRGASTFDPETLMDPALNLDFSAWYFNYLRTLVGGDRLLYILASYNGGPGRLGRWRDQLPTRDDDIFIKSIPNEETRSYTWWVYENVHIYETILKSENYQAVPF